MEQSVDNFTFVSPTKLVSPLSQSVHYQRRKINRDARGMNTASGNASIEHLKIEVAVNAPQAADGIVEDSVVRRSEVLLDITWIVMVRDVDDLYPAEKFDAVAPKFEIERILKLQVEARECGKTPRLVAPPDVVPVYVQL